MKFEEEKTVLLVLNARADKVIKKLVVLKIKNSVKDELLDITREIKAQLASVERLVDAY